MWKIKVGFSLQSYITWIGDTNLTKKLILISEYLVSAVGFHFHNSVSCNLMPMVMQVVSMNVSLAYACTYNHNARDILFITSLHSLSIQEVQCLCFIQVSCPSYKFHARAIIKYLLTLLPSLIITSYCLYQFTNAKGMGMPGPPSLWIYWYITWLLVNDSKFEFLIS